MTTSPDSEVPMPEVSPPETPSSGAIFSQIKSVLWGKHSFRTWVTIIISVVVLALSYQSYRKLAAMLPSPNRREPVAPSLSVDAFETSATDIREIIVGYGSAQADREVTLSAQVSGEIIETFKLKVGEWVDGSKIVTEKIGGKDAVSREKKGDTLIRIDPRNYRQKVQQAEGRLAEIDAEAVKLVQEEKNLKRKLEGRLKDIAVYQKDFDKIKQLFTNKTGAINASEYNTAVLKMRQYEDAILQIETEVALIPSRKKVLQQKKKALQNDLKIATLELERTDVIPPFSGYLGDIMVEQGQYVRVGDKLMTLSDRTKIEIPIPVSMDDYSSIVSRVDARDYPVVELRSNEKSNRTWKGYLMRYAPQADEKTRTLNVYLEVNNQEQSVELLPGVFVVAQIHGKTYGNVIAIPRSLITAGAVYIASPSKENKNELVIQKQPVEVVRYLQSLAIIKTGLQPGEKVISTNLDIISELVEKDIPFHTSILNLKSIKDEQAGQQIRRWEISTSDSRSKK